VPLYGAERIRISGWSGLFVRSLESQPFLVRYPGAPYDLWKEKAELSTLRYPGKDGLDEEIWGFRRSYKAWKLLRWHRVIVKAKFEKP
jgi:hypothetical protein